MPDNFIEWSTPTLPKAWNRVLNLAWIGVVLTLLTGGCDFLAVTDEQFVKNKIREHAETITASMKSRDWSASAMFYDQNIKWQRDVFARTPQKLQEMQALQKAHPGTVTWAGPDRATVTLQGKEAAKGFLGSLHDIGNMDAFYTIVHSIGKVNPELIEAKVTFQAHIVLSSTELNYSNRVWEGRMGWVKRGPGLWKICYIIESSERKDGKFSRI